MTTSLACCANVGVSLIDLPPRTEPIDDRHASLQAAVQWQFSPGTRSRHWHNRAKTLEFKRRTGVKTFEDLLDDPVNGPGVTNVRSGHQPSYVLAPQIPDDPDLTDFLTRNKGFIRG